MNRAAAAAAALLLAALLAGCSPSATGPEGSGSGSPSGSLAGSPSPSSSDGPRTGSPSPTPTAKRPKLPTDCRAILSEDVLAQLADTPLNDAAFAPHGVGADGTLTCVWGDPRADTTRLITKISAMNRGPALDMLNTLVADEGFTCFTPDGGTRCEKTWQNETYPVTDGRTLFWRDGILIDTRYSNLAPDGYTSSIVEKLFG